MSADLAAHRSPHSHSATHQYEIQTSTIEEAPHPGIERRRRQSSRLRRRGRAGNGSLRVTHDPSDPQSSSLTHDPCDPWPMGHRGRHPILNQLMIDKFTADTKPTKTSICCLVVGLLQYWIDYWIVKEWRSTRVKTNEMPFLNFLLVLFLTLSFTVNFL